MAEPGSARERLARSLDHPEADDRGTAHLDRGDAHLAVSLRVVRVAHRKQCALDGDGYLQSRPLRELLDVHVAAVLPGRYRAQAFRGGRSRTRHRSRRIGSHDEASPAR